METSTHTQPNPELLALLESLTANVEEAMNAVIALDWDKRRAEILDRCFKATAAAKAGKMLLERESRVADLPLQVAA